jgi:hypothetical protein
LLQTWHSKKVLFYMKRNETPECGCLQPKHVAGILETKRTYGYSAAGPAEGVQVVQAEISAHVRTRAPTLQPTTLHYTTLHYTTPT